MVHPGAADIFFTSWQEQSEHRRAIENRVIESDITSERVGMALAFILALVIVGCGTYLLSIDKDAYGFAAILAPIATLAGLFVYSKRQDRKELEAKDPENQ